MKPMIISLSGVRGIIGENLTPDVLSKLAASFGTILRGGKVVVATDSRISRQMCLDAVTSGLISSGCGVINIGISPTPSLQIMIQELKARGGICITASHNPPEWNGLKFYSSEGILLGKTPAKKLLSTYERSRISPAPARRGGINYVPWDKLGEVREKKEAHLFYINAVLKKLNVKLIRKRKFKVVIDCGNGAGAVSAPVFLEKLGCQVIKLNCETHGFFNRPPEPIPKNIGELRSVVPRKKAEVGFAQDADADRLAIVSEEGKCLGEDYSLALAAQFVLTHKPGPVVTNLSTTMAIDDVAEKFGCRCLRTKIGEINVVETMKRVGAVIGGEGNGGVIFPSVHYGRDSLVGMGLILQYMAETHMPISALVKSIPQYHIKKGKIPVKGAGRDILKKLRSSFKDAKLDLRDGVKAMWGDCWVHVRPSGTEPVVRIVAEAKTKKKASQLYKMAESLIQ
jgi:phosphomannomutase